MDWGFKGIDCKKRHWVGIERDGGDERVVQGNVVIGEGIGFN